MLFLLDSAILRVVARFVRLWCGATGKSNFSLAKALAYCMPIPYVAWSISAALKGTTGELLTSCLFFVLATTLVSFSVIPRLRKAEDALERWEGGPLPHEVFIYHSPRAVMLRIFEVALTVLIFVGKVQASDIAIGGYFFFLALHYYAAACTTPKNKSKVRELFKRLRFSTLKLRTAPKPTPA